jgi:hypothetical protein
MMQSYTRLIWSWTFFFVGFLFLSLNWSLSFCLFVLELAYFLCFYYRGGKKLTRIDNTYKIIYFNKTENLICKFSSPVFVNNPAIWFCRKILIYFFGNCFILLPTTHLIMCENANEILGIRSSVLFLFETKRTFKTFFVRVYVCVFHLRKTSNWIRRIFKYWFISIWKKQITKLFLLWHNSIILKSNWFRIN